MENLILNLESDKNFCVSSLRAFELLKLRREKEFQRDLKSVIFWRIVGRPHFWTIFHSFFASHRNDALFLPLSNPNCGPEFLQKLSRVSHYFYLQENCHWSLGCSNRFVPTHFQWNLMFSVLFLARERIGRRYSQICELTAQQKPAIL